MASDEALNLLRSIDASLKALLALSQRRMSGGANGAGASAGPAVASDRDLDGPHGDPVIKAKDPRDWSGPSMKGRRFSQCDPVYLELLAERYDWFARKAHDEGDPQKEKYARLDGARARGWAARIRAGKAPAAAVTDESAGWGSGEVVDAEWDGSSNDWEESR